jgi:hypothetical protein
MKLAAEEMKIIVEDTLKEFRRYQLSNSLKSDVCL